MNFGVYQDIAAQEIDELLSHYEDDFNEAASYLDGEGVTRLAQLMYLLKSKEYENVWWRIENRVHDLADVEGALDSYNIANILRSFSRSQENQMTGSNKLFIHLEPLVIKHLDNIATRDLGHVLYAYSIRNLGNPELYKAFEQKLE